MTSHALRRAASALRTSLAACATLLVLSASASAQSIRSGFLQQQLNLRDDRTETVNIGFFANLSGNEGDLTTVCANGFLIFGFVGVDDACAIPGALAIVDKGLGEGPVLRAPTIGTLVGTYGNVLVPYFADFDATAAGSGQVFAGAGTVDGFSAFAVTWNGVRGFGGGAASFFQTVLINRGAGSFDFEFNYGPLGVAPLRVGYGDDGGFVGAGEATAYLPNGAIPVAGLRLTGSFVNGISPTDPFGRGTGIGVAVIPEPSTVALVAAGAAALGLAGARRRRRAA